MKKLYNIYFSPTDSTMEVTEQISEAFAGEKQIVDLCEDSSQTIQIENDAVAIIAVPCYGGRVPKTAAERLLKVEAAATPAILCVTFGNRAYEDALAELFDIAEARGFKVIGGCSVVTEHNIMHIFGQGRPDTKDKAEIKDFAEAVRKKLEKGETQSPDFPGNRPYKERHGGAAPIVVDEEKCTGCGLCGEKCPVKAIAWDGKHTDKEVCIGCMRCIKICPAGSRKLADGYVDKLIEKLAPACEARKENEFYW